MSPEKAPEPHLILDRRVKGLGVSPTLASRERARALIATGRSIAQLGLGQSPFPVPEPVVEALRASASERDYLPVRGLPALRDAVASYHRERHDVGRTAADIVVGPGSKELMFLLKLAFSGEVLVPSPAWVSHDAQARLAGRPLRWLPVHVESDLKVTPDVLEAACRRGGARRHLLVLNYPNNPTGATYSAAELADLAEVCARRNILVLSDEIYGELDHEGRHVSLARFYERGTIISSGLSKWCGAGGWRLGVFSMPAAMRALGDAIAAAGSETYSTTSAPIQHAAVRAFQLGDEIEAYLGKARKILRTMTRWCAAELRTGGLTVIEPAGAFYLFPDFGPLVDRLAAAGIGDDVTLCERLLDEAGVSCLPGTSFGMLAGTFYIRLALVDFDGGKALAACAEEELDEAFVAAHCAEIHRGVRAISSWARALPDAS